MEDTKQLTHEDKVAWMALWAARNGLQLQLNGEVGLGRPCVGVTVEDKYPNYYWHDRKTYERIDPNGEVWTPPNAYHKHDCVAVLGEGVVAEAELYEWLQWFDANGFKLEVGDVPREEYDHDGAGFIRILMGQHRFARMVRKGA